MKKLILSKCCFILPLAATAIILAACNFAAATEDGEFAFINLHCSSSLMEDSENQSRITFFPEDANNIWEISNFTLNGIFHETDEQNETTLVEMELGRWDSYGDLTSATLISLKPGEWNFTLTADYNGRTNYIARIAPQTFEAGNTYNLSFNLMQIQSQDGTGDVSVTIEWYASNDQVGLLRAGLFDADGNSVEDFELEDLYFTTDETDYNKLCATYKKYSVPIGSYILKFYFYRDYYATDQINVFSYGIQVVQNLSTNGIHTIEKMNYRWNLTLNPNGGNWDGDWESKILTETSGTRIRTPRNPTRTGYTFDKWTDSEGTPIPSKFPDRDAYYYANWIAHTYKVEFYANGGTGTMGEQTFTYDELQNLAENTFTKQDYGFTAWNTEADGSGISYRDGESVINLTDENNATIKLYAQWKKVEASGDIGLPGEYKFILKQGAKTIYEKSTVYAGNTLEFTIQDESGNTISNCTNFRIEIRQGVETIPGASADGNSLYVPEWFAGVGGNYEVYMEVTIDGNYYNYTVRGIRIE